MPIPHPRNVWYDESGSTSVMFVVALPILIAAAGAASMYAYQVMTKTQLQAALDAGVLAGTALDYGAKDAERIEAARKAFQDNFDGGSKSKYEVKTGSGVPNFTVSNWEVSGIAYTEIENSFSFILGNEMIGVRAAAAGAKMESIPICILGLNPEHKETIDMTGQPVITAKDCAVQANSTSGSGMNQKGKPQLNAKMIGTTGGYTGAGYSVKPVTGTIPMDDPYGDLPFPPSGGCDFTDAVYSGVKATAKPGVYCGGLRIKAGAEVTMAPGIYVMKDGPLWMNGSSSLAGEEVMVAFTGDTATYYMEGSSSLRLTSPASGTYANMQFMQDRETETDNLYFTVIGNAEFDIDGAIYTPGLNLWFAGGSEVNISCPSYAIVADKIWTQDQSHITVAYENKRGVASAGAKGFKYGARLVR